MLKRYQVLLDDWQREYLNFITEKYDVSFSEAIRILISISVICVTTKLDPKYKTNLKIQDLIEVRNKVSKKGENQAEFHGGISKLYFEARKAVEHRMGLAKKEKSKK
ncbi:hypothetical protein ACFL0P_04480 [Candidatus Omnitrophota bacterium]